MSGACSCLGKILSQEKVRHPIGINKAIMGPSTQQFFFSSSDVVATTCFFHPIIIRRQTVVLIETCCGNNIGRGGEELLR
jgi:hypothetical protein